jgi:hypothetical protein
MATTSTFGMRLVMFEITAARIAEFPKLPPAQGLTNPNRRIGGF